MLKRLETNKIRGAFNEAEKTLLVPISLGVSSVCLLHILDKHLQSRKQQGRHAGYSLHVLYIDESSVLNHDSCGDGIVCLKERFPSYEQGIVCLEEYDDYGIKLNNSIMDQAQSNDYASHSKAQKMEMQLQSVLSPTSRSDLINMIRRKLIHIYAQRHNCDWILYGDSTTLLAEKTLSETAKGRGGHLPLLTADGADCIYPLRDLLKKELIMYAQTTSPPLTSLIIEPKLRSPISSSKDTTIDDLMHQYFDSVEQNFPSIVANVVRTSSKLKLPSSDDTDRMCSMCKNPISKGSWGGEQNELSTSGTSDNSMPMQCCYGCARTFGKALG